MSLRYSAHKPDGIVISTDFEGKETEQDTLQCAHCGMHWIVRPGREPNFCVPCGTVICGKRACLQRGCYPMAKQLDDIEQHGHLIVA